MYITPIHFIFLFLFSFTWRCLPWTLSRSDRTRRGCLRTARRSLTKHRIMRSSCRWVGLRRRWPCRHRWNLQRRLHVRLQFLKRRNGWQWCRLDIALRIENFCWGRYVASYNWFRQPGLYWRDSYTLFWKIFTNYLTGIIFQYKKYSGYVKNNGLRPLSFTCRLCKTFCGRPRLRAGARSARPGAVSLRAGDDSARPRTFVFRNAMHIWYSSSSASVSMSVKETSSWFLTTVYKCKLICFLLLHDLLN